MPVDLYCHIVAPFCRSVILLADALEVELNFIEVNVLKKEQFKPEFLAVSFKFCAIKRLLIAACRVSGYGDAC